ncbi:MAG: DUF2336 domain-containing protein [Ahrensia sp.]|nr:DUF2336 domain-containing protein [Ahrensia sp.]
MERFRQWSQRANAQERAAAIAQLAETWLDDQVDDCDRRQTEQAFTLYLDDPNLAVRVALANAVAPHSHAPRKLIWALMQDIPDVSAVVFQQSTALRPADLLHAIERNDPAIQTAIASRQDLGVDPVRALVRQGGAQAAVTLLENPSVRLSPMLKHDLAERLRHDARLRGVLLEDDQILPQTRHLLVSTVSESLRHLGSFEGWVDDDRMAITALDASGKAAVEIASALTPSEMANYVTHLRSTNQLTAAVLLRAVCIGNLGLFQAGVANLSGASFGRVGSIMSSARPSALNALFAKAGLSKSALLVSIAALQIWKWSQSEEEALSEIVAAVEESQEIDAATLALLGRMACDIDRDAVRYMRADIELQAA